MELQVVKNPDLGSRLLLEQVKLHFHNVDVHFMLVTAVGKAVVFVGAGGLLVEAVQDVKGITELVGAVRKDPYAPG